MQQAKQLNWDSTVKKILLINNWLIGFLLQEAQKNNKTAPVVQFTYQVLVKINTTELKLSTERYFAKSTSD